MNGFIKSFFHGTREMNTQVSTYSRVGGFNVLQNSTGIN